MNSKTRKPPTRYTNSDLHNMDAGELRYHLATFCEETRNRQDPRGQFFAYADGVAHLIARLLEDATAAQILSDCCNDQEG